MFCVSHEVVRLWSLLYSKHFGRLNNFCSIYDITTTTWNCVDSCFYVHYCYKKASQRHRLAILVFGCVFLWLYTPSTPHYAHPRHEPIMLQVGQRPSFFHSTRRSSLHSIIHVPYCWTGRLPRWEIVCPPPPTCSKSNCLLPSCVPRGPVPYFERRTSRHFQLSLNSLALLSFVIPWHDPISEQTDRSKFSILFYIQGSSLGKLQRRGDSL